MGSIALRNWIFLLIPIPELELNWINPVRRDWNCQFAIIWIGVEIRYEVLHILQLECTKYFYFLRYTDGVLYHVATFISSANSLV